MAHYDVELVYNKGSRDTTVSPTTADQVLVLAFCLDPNLYSTTPVDNFYNYSGDVAALEYAYDIFPPSRYLPARYDDLDSVLLNLVSISLSQKGTNQWEAKGTYRLDKTWGLGYQPFGGAPGDIALPYYQMNFTVGGGTRTLFKNMGNPQPIIHKSNTATMEVPDSVNTFKAIGATEDTLKGVDIPTADLRLQVTGYYLPDKFDIAFIKTVQELIAGPYFTGSYNQGVYLDSPIGEVSLLSASGGTQVIDIVPITYEFSLIPNLLSTTADPGFPDFPPIRGQDYIEYLWTKTYDQNGKKILSTPQIRIIHEIKQPADYLRLGLTL